MGRQRITSADLNLEEVLRVVTVYVPIKYLDLYEKLIEKGIFPSRSEAVRQAIRSHVDKLMETMLKVDELMKKDSDWWKEYKLKSGEIIRIPIGES